MNFDPVERHLFLEGLLLRYGYDFRQYSEASLNRRLENVMRKTDMTDFYEILKLALRDKEFFNTILPLMTVSTTEPFRDPGFFRSLRQNVAPVLRTHPTINVWIAGCSTGQEIYSLAILFQEEGLLNRATIYATDINPIALRTARDGIYDLESMRTFTRNYIEAGGQHSPSDYYTADYGSARFDPILRRNVVFSEHNLVTDHVFTEANLILCRNVLIYFNRELQDRALRLFSHSLIHRGFLCLGSKESIRFSSIGPDFDALDGENRIFQKKLMESVLQSRFADDRGEL
ncbi:MAG: protein-glutamate O-methyltransferase CheR [Bdellovibrionaceae bacterium]|nr:protein-glutamate O-methyltransferase CheR [Pseudobdellovibrionaceae bacterium]MBX3032865.1 protein-glutamate O-methyltransferase CheR [Pseudobdellovibrionaceae bacterium]